MVDWAFTQIQVLAMHILRRIASTTAILSCIFLVFLYVLGCFCVCFFVCLLSLLLLFFFVVVIVVVFFVVFRCLGEEGCGAGVGCYFHAFTVSSIKAVHDL